jgi:hypothetical protein
VGWTEASEWLAYDVRVATAGAYTLTARVASGSVGTKTLRMLVDGVQVANFTFTDASGWQSWRDVMVDNVNLSAGVHLVTLEMATAGLNVNFVDVQAAGNPELLGNGAFANGLTGWITQMTAPAAGSWGVDAGSAKATITAPGGQPWEIQIAQQVSLTGGRVYTLEFDVKAEATPKSFKVVVEHNADPWTKYHEQLYTVTAAAGSFQHFKIPFTQPVTDAAVRVGFHFGTFNESDVWLDNASLK